MNNELFFLTIGFLLINFLVIFFFNKIKFFHYAIDYPDKGRKFHKRPTSLAGGSILIFNLLIYTLIILFNEQYLDENFFDNYYEFFLFIIASFFIYLIGLYDDKFNLNPLKKFIFLIIVLSLFTYLNYNSNINEILFSFYSEKIFTQNYSVIFTIFCYLVYINAFNMFDGINLQSSIYSLIVLFSIVLIYHVSFILIILIIFFIFFLFLNYKNQSFLGDNGSLLVPFLIGFFFIKLYKNNFINNADQIFLFMIVPGVDMIRLFFERLKNKKSPLLHDRNHLHHLLIKKISFKTTTLIMTSLTLVPIIFSIIIQNKLYIIILFILFYGFLIKKLKY